MKKKERKSFCQGFWPTTFDRETAKKTSRQGFWAAVFVSLFTGVMAWSQPSVFSRVTLFDAFLFAMIAFGIYRMSRTAAVAGLVLYILEQASAWMEHGFKNPVIAILLVFCFINGIRGTFAYHELAKKKDFSKEKVCPSCNAFQDASKMKCPKCDVMLVPFGR